MNIDDRIRSLTRNEIKVLYWKCRGDQYKQIALRYDKGVKWVQGLMTSVYRKLGVPKGLYPPDLWEYLKIEVCPIVIQLIGDNEKSAEENLERWPLYGMRVLGQSGGTTIYEEKEKEDPDEPPDPEIMAMVLVEQREEEKTQPPPPIVIPDQKRLPGQTRRFPVLGCVLIGLGVFFAVVMAGINYGGRFLNSLQATPSNTQAVLPQKTESPDEVLPTQTVFLLPSNTPEPTFTLEPTLTFTPEVPPTAVPLPIREDFSRQYSDLWTVTGNPFLSESTANFNFKGVLTTNEDERASLRIGNTAWTDYLVELREVAIWMNKDLIIGVRVKDLNNMVGLECTGSCRWFVIYNGIREEIGKRDSIYMADKFTLSAQGDTFTAVGHTNDPNMDDFQMLLVLPPKYQGKFPGGGVLLEILGVEIDYIAIYPIR